MRTRFEGDDRMSPATIEADALVRAALTRTPTLSTTVATDDDWEATDERSTSWARAYARIRSATLRIAINCALLLRGCDVVVFRLCEKQTNKQNTIYLNDRISVNTVFANRIEVTLSCFIGRRIKFFIKKKISVWCHTKNRSCNL